MQRLSRQILLFTLAALAVFVGMSLSRWMAGGEAELTGGTVYPQPRPLADFRLVDHRGEPFTRDDLRGGWHLLFFGFTHCPDVCPLTLAVLTNAVEVEAGADPRPLAGVVLVSVDPERDTPQRLARYVEGFGDTLVGVTGDPQAIADFAADAAIAFERVPLAGGGYTMDHSAAVLAVDPAGRIAAVFTPPLDAAVIRADLVTLARAGPAS